MTTYNIEFTERELESIFKQIQFSMQLDYCQHVLLTEAQQVADAQEFLERQQVRFSVLTKIVKVLDQELPLDIKSLYEDAEGIMVFTRGFGNGKCRGTDSPTTRDSGSDKRG